MRQLALLLLPALLAGACSATAKSRRLEGNYELADPGQGWRAVKPGGADRAWSHDDFGAAIYADSNCGARYEDSDLRALAEHLTWGLTGEEEVSTSEGRLDGRDAFTRRVRGTLDGVGVELAATVVKKDECVYDFVLIAPPSRFDAVWGDYLAAAA